MLAPLIFPGSPVDGWWFPQFLKKSHIFSNRMMTKIYDMDIGILRDNNISDIVIITDVCQYFPYSFQCFIWVRSILVQCSPFHCLVNFYCWISSSRCLLNLTLAAFCHTSQTSKEGLEDRANSQFRFIPHHAPIQNLLDRKILRRRTWIRKINKVK